MKLTFKVKRGDRGFSDLQEFDALIAFIGNSEPFLLVQKFGNEVIAVLRRGEEGFEEVMSMLGYPCRLETKTLPTIGSPSNIEFLKTVASKTQS